VLLHCQAVHHEWQHLFLPGAPGTLLLHDCHLRCCCVLLLLVLVLLGTLLVLLLSGVVLVLVQGRQGSA
jgi:hypothetical protein